jgi:hypothetical protein
MELNSNAITGSGICSSPVPPPSTPSTAVLGRAGTGGTPAPRERRRGHRGRRRSEGEAEGAADWRGGCGCGHFCWKGRWPCPLTVYGGRDPLLLSVQYYYSEGKRASRLSRLP